MTRRNLAALFCKWPVAKTATTGPANMPVFQ